MAPAVASLLILVIATRTLSPAEVGRFGLAFATVQMLAIALGSWADQAALRFYPGFASRGEGANFRRHHGRILVELAAVAAGVGGLIAWATTGNVGFTPTEAVLALATLVALVVLTHAEYILIAEQRSGAYTAVEALRGVLNLSVSLTLLTWWRQDAVALLAGLLASTLVPVVLAMRLARLSPRTTAIGEHGAYLRRSLKYGLPMVGWFFGFQFLTLSGRFFIEHLRGTEEVGIYHANASVIPGLIPILFTPLLMAAHAIIMRASESDATDDVEALLTRFTRYFLLFAVPIAAAATAASRPLTQTLVGSQFQEGHIVVPWLIWGLVAWSLGMYGNKRFEIAAKTRVLLALVLVCALTQAVLTIALVPRMGYFGAAVATSVGYGLYPVLVFLAPGTPIRWRVPVKLLARAGLAGAAGVAGGAAMASRVAPFPALSEALIVGGLAASVSLFLLVALREVTFTELMRLPQALRQR